MTTKIENLLSAKPWTIDVAEGQLDGMGGYNHYLVLLPEERHVYLFACVGAGTPIDVWEGRAATLDLPRGVDGEHVRECLQAHTEQLNTIAECYLGSFWDGSNQRGRWSEDEAEERAIRDAKDEIVQALENLPRYWDTSDWLSTDVHGAIADTGAALESGWSLKEWSEGEVSSHASQALLDAEDLERTLLSFVAEDPECYLTVDYGTRYIPGASILAELAGVDLPALDIEDEE